MFGAILGDIVGSPYEFDWNNIKTKDFPLFSPKSCFTDDSVMSLAVAQALLDAPDLTDEDAVKEELVNWMRELGRNYPDAGYGGRFAQWLEEDDPRPYHSYGNGAAMRVAAAAWVANSMEETRRLARWSAEVTHDHPEGIRGAEATAAAIYLGRTGHTKAEIRDYVVGEFGYDLSRTCDEIRPTYHHVESCQQTVPEAITAFLEGESFEDVLRTAVSLGGDSDTLAAIAGSIAEGYYGLGAEWKKWAVGQLPQQLKILLGCFWAAMDLSGKMDDFPLHDR